MRKSVLIQLLFVFIFNILSSNAFSASFDPAQKWRQIKSKHFMVYYHDDIEEVAQRVAHLADEAHSILSPKYNWKPLGRTAIVLTDTLDDPNGFATVLPYHSMFIRVTAPPPESPLALYDDWLRLLVTHEYLHVIHMDQARGILKIPRLFLGKIVAPNGIHPGWMREGLATYEETLQTSGGRGRHSYTDMLLRTAIINNDWPKIDEADGLSWKWPRFLPAYLYGVEFMQWLADKYGDDKLVEYQTRTSKSLIFFMHNHTAKRVWGKSLYKLWREWHNEMRIKYNAEINELRADGTTSLRIEANTGEAAQTIALSPNGQKMVYVSSDPRRSPNLILRDTQTNKEKVILKNFDAKSATFDRTGERLLLSALGSYKRYYYYSDVYLYDLKTGSLKRLTKGRRARDAAFMPDEKSIVYVVEHAGKQQLAYYDLNSKHERILSVKSSGNYSRFSHPTTNIYGEIAVSSWQHGQYDIYVYDSHGKLLHRVTNDRAVEMGPRWSVDGSTLYFSTDRSGVSNIAKWRRGSGVVERVTNVDTGAFEPSISNDGRLYVQYYNGKGFDVREVQNIRTISSHQVGAKDFAHKDDLVKSDLPFAESLRETYENSAPFESKKYSPYSSRLFVPRYLIPGFYATGNGLLLSAATGGMDPLQRHVWIGGGTYRTDANHFGYFFNYSYNRYKTPFNLGVLDYAVDFGNITFASAGGATRTVRMFEKRRRGYAGISVPIKRHNFNLQYFIENRDNITLLSAGERAALNLDRFAGGSLTYSWGDLKKYPASISHESGHKILMNLTVTDKVLGSNERNEQQIFTGELRQFFPLWKRHVFAFHVKGGITWGDRLVQGTYGMGGALGEGSFGGGGSLYYFPLRGLPVSSLSKTRALLFSSEYRIPLASPQRGLGTTPFYLKNLHAAFFADYGNAWNAGESTGKYFFGKFFLGTGAELRADFVVGHGLPIVGRLGYGIIVLNRDRLGNATDPLLGTPVKNGMLVLQLGTSF